jgi:hypothetical protein
MALELNFSAAEGSGCNSIVIYDKTGAYSISNLTGYGSPNFDLVTLSAASLKFTSPSGTINTLALPVPPTTIPETTGIVGFTVLGTDLGLSSSESFEDGKWMIDVTLTFADPSSTTGFTDVTQNIVLYFLCQVNCCVNKIVARYNPLSCCQDSELDTALDAYISFQAIKQAVKCGKIEKANSILTQLKKLCAASTCNC